MIQLPPVGAETVPACGFFVACVPICNQGKKLNDKVEKA